MDRLEAMQIFVSTVETGSFSAASRKLGVPLPTVSRKVSELEDHLKSRLLVRTTRKLSLTDAGAAYLAASKRILDDISAAETLAAGEYTAPRGELIITAPITFGRFHVLTMVNDFLKSLSGDQHPDVLVGQSRQSVGGQHRHGGPDRDAAGFQHDRNARGQRSSHRGRQPGVLREERNT